MSDGSKSLVHPVEPSAEWIRNLARNAQNAEFVERTRKAAEAVDCCLEASRRKCSGVFVLKGTRFPLSHLFGELAEGRSIRSIAKGFDLDQEQMSTLLHALAVCFDVPVADD